MSIVYVLLRKRCVQMKKDELYTKVEYFLKEIMSGYVELEQIIEGNQNNLTIIKGYLEVLDSVMILRAELKNGVFSKTPLYLALLQCLNKLRILLKHKIDLFLLLEKKGAFFFFKYRRLQHKMNKQKRELGNCLERLENEFYGYYCNCGNDIGEVGME